MPELMKPDTFDSESTIWLLGGRYFRSLKLMLTAAKFPVEHWTREKLKLDKSTGALIKREKPSIIISEQSSTSLLTELPDGLEKDAMIVRLPSLMIDGVFSLASLGSNGSVLGAECIRNRIQETSVDSVVDEIIDGKIDFQNVKRLEKSLSTLRKIEEDCDISLSDYLEERYPYHPVMESADMPCTCVYNHIARKLSRLLGTNIPTTPVLNPVQRSGLRLPREARAFTPYDVDSLRLHYRHDYDWISQVRPLIARYSGTSRKKDE